MTPLTALLLLLPAGQAQAPGQETYRNRILPLLEKYCTDCHGDGTRKGGFALDEYADYGALLADRKRWRKAVQLLHSHVMPPAKKAKPTPEERRAILEWIEDSVFYVDPDRPDPGHVVLRRLNREEYNNAVRDVFHVAVRPGDQFPPDDSGYGFDNIGDVLALSPMLMEKYLNAAREVVAEATTPADVPQVGREPHGSHVSVFGGTTEKRNQFVILRDAKAEVGVEVDIPAAAMYRLVLQAAADPPGPLEVLCDGEKVGTINVEGKWREKGPSVKSNFTLFPLPSGPHRISVRHGKGVGVSAIRRFRFRGPFNPAPRTPTPFMKELLGEERSRTTPMLHISGEDLEHGEGRGSLDTGAAFLTSNGYRYSQVVASAGGRYRFRVKAGAQQAGAEPVKFELRIGDVRVGPLKVTAREQRPQWIEAGTDLEKGVNELQVWFVNEYKDGKTGAERALWIHELSLEGPIRPEGGLKHVEIPGLLARVGRRLYRRPLDPTEKDRLSSLVDATREAGEDAWSSLRLGLTTLLASPNFLFWNPPVPAGDPANGSVPIDDLALASRLSSFLWSSVPDEELLALAEAGGLRKALPAQVKRMLADPRSRALTENFAGQWLQLRDMTLVKPDPVRFPEYDAALAADMRKESEALFDHVLRGNRPVLEFLSADYTFLNGRLAKHYGLPDVEGEAFRKVSLAGTPRRGFLTQGSFLTLTSHPTRTAPVKRGNFVLEKILGTPPPPAPNDVPSLEETAGENPEWTLRRKLEAHQKDPRCASCHAFMDPMGYAFANYDAIGRWRDRVDGKPVDASGRLVSGETFRDYRELGTMIVRDRPDEFTRALAEQLLTYALGRGVEYTDKTAVRAIVERTRRADYRFREMILAVCESVPFRKIRPEGR